MARNTRHWRRFLHDLLVDVENPDRIETYDGVCVFSLSGRVEYSSGCFTESADAEPLQLLAVFEQLTHQALQEERVAHDPSYKSTQSLTPALRLDGCVLHVVSASFSSVCAVASGQTRGLVAQKLSFGVLLVAFSAPQRLERVFAHLERACAALRR
jgi:hypothetical protein